MSREVRRAWGLSAYHTYFLGDLTPSTRLSKACLAGVAVEADDICTESQDMERGARPRDVTASYHGSDQQPSRRKPAAALVTVRQQRFCENREAHGVRRQPKRKPRMPPFQCIGKPSRGTVGSRTRRMWWEKRKVWYVEGKRFSADGRAANALFGGGSAPFTVIQAGQWLARTPESAPQ